MEHFVDGHVYAKCPKRSWIIGKLEGWDKAKNVGTVRAINDGGDTLSNVKEQDVHPMRDGGTVEDVDDLLLLTELHDATLLHCIKHRYMKDVIYTNIGAITVALNPFNFKIPRYMDNMMPSYLSEGEVIEKSLPHSWACAHNTYYEMKRDGKDQCILVSGESGAGKTEASKIVMKYLASVSCLKGEPSVREEAALVGKKINLSSPALEAFGNAKTVRNDNSSRFGKFMRVKFDGSGFLVGAHITKYLLEKSRIVTASQGERIYHSFYLIIRCKDRSKYLLGDEKQYRSLNAGQMLNNPEFNTHEEFELVCQSMAGMGIATENINSLWKAIAGILHFENVEFTAEGEGSQPNAASLVHIANGCQMWGIDQSAYIQEVRENTLTIMGNQVRKLLTPPMAQDARSAVNKYIYDNAFSWLVSECNNNLDHEDCTNWIGLLDIFGFEDFKHNSFEQLCINLTNETLQHHYNTYIFCKDVEECRSEGIDMSDVSFPDNTPCLKMISGSGSIMALLDEECQLGSGSDASFFSKVSGKFNGNPFFIVDKLSRTNFVVRHYAGDVSYDTTDFREKNLDTLKDAWKLLLRSSSDSLIKELLPAPVDVKGPKPTVSVFFRRQLQELMDLINSTSPHWVRCVKPHPAKKPLMFDNTSVMNQLSSSGVLGTVKIRKAGYAVRIPKEQFLGGFKIVSAAAGTPTTIDGIFQACGYGKNDAQVGTRRVFLRSHIYMDLETRKKKALLNSTRVVQAFSHVVCAFQKANKAMFASNRLLIDELRKHVRQLLALQDKEAQQRQKYIHDAARLWKMLLGKEAQASKGVKLAEAEKRAKIIRAMRIEHEEQREILEDEETSARDEFLIVLQEVYMDMRHRMDVARRAAEERQARREHAEVEKALMIRRREACERRREHDRQHMFEQCSKRMEPTVAREDKTIRSLQRIQRQKQMELEAAQRQMEKELRREEAVQKHRHEIQRQREERAQESLRKRLHTAQTVAMREAAFERYYRVMREDFEWQNLERQMLKGQQLVLEEARRAFLREKAESDKERRKTLEEEDIKVRDQQRLVMVERRQRDEQQSKLSAEKMLEEEKRLLAEERKQREAIHIRHKEKGVERAIGWDNDRRERILLQRPDITKTDIDELPLAVRVPAPAPFIMANNQPTFTKVWTPFMLIRFDVAPSSSLGINMPFTVSWVCSKIPGGNACVSINGATGELFRHRILKAVGEARFVSPNEWFSGLEISFIVGDKILREISVSSDKL